jgi:hypothetical protein
MPEASTMQSRQQTLDSSIHVGINAVALVWIDGMNRWSFLQKRMRKNKEGEMISEWKQTACHRC